jgi:type I restriction enzyme S subunit
MNILIGSVGLSQYYGCVSPVYYVFRAKTGANIEYLNYLFSMPSFQRELRKYANGILEIRLRVSSGNILKRKVAIPPSNEQKAIVDYLNREIEHIDAIVAEVRASIEEYKAWKASIIYEAVTKGLNPNAEMKDSGIEWLGPIPNAWNIVKITRVLDRSHPYPIGDGDHGLIKTTDYVESGIPYIRVQNLGWGTELSLDNVVYITHEKNEAIRNSTLKPNDILFAKTGATIGKTGIVPASLPVSNTTSHVGKLTVSSKYNPRYVFYVLSSMVGYNQFWEIASAKTTRPELSIEEIKSIKITLPAARIEQDQIVQYLDKKCPHIDNLIAEKETLIADLETYKKSLIFEVVTGKRKVV